MHTSRRTLLRTGLVTGGAAALSARQLDTRASAAATPPRSNPFTLGVASGDPRPDGVVLWTRLAVNPVAANGLGGMSASMQELQWQVATSATFAKIVRSGRVKAWAVNAHSVHVEVGGLLPGREYFYRFRLGRYYSRVGRTRTAPAPDTMPGSLAMSFVSCSAWERGWFTAYRRLAQDQPDLVLHLGDYMYEYKPNIHPNAVRNHRGPETVTLANYRQRHAQYKTDPDLRAALAVAPWLVVWDDHEVSNNWADETPDSPEKVPGFMNRRAAAFKAYYENMPLRRSSIPSGPDMRLHRRIQWGRLANLHMLDTRQYRDDQACGDGLKDCPAADDPSRSLLGMAQEQWLADGFASSRATWDVLGQSVFFSQRDATATPDNTVAMDAWDGYRPSRARVTDSFVRAQVRNPIVLTGDVHAHWASDVHADFSEPDSPVVGSEFVCSSVTSGGNGYDEPSGKHPWMDYNPNLKFWTNLRGYVQTRITPESFTVNFRCVPKVTVKGAAAFTRATFVVDDGVRGMRQTYNSFKAGRAAPAPRSDAEKIRDTIRTESQ
jgi:alkaline phosphatase D